MHSIPCNSKLTSQGASMAYVFGPYFQLHPKLPNASTVYSRSAWLQSEIALFYKQNSKYAVIMENKPTVLYSTLKDVNTR